MFTKTDSFSRLSAPRGVAGRSPPKAQPLRNLYEFQRPSLLSVKMLKPKPNQWALRHVAAETRLKPTGFVSAKSFGNVKISPRVLPKP